MIFSDPNPFDSPKILPSGTINLWVADHLPGNWLSIKEKVPPEITKSNDYNDKVMISPCGSATNIAGIICIRYDKKEESKGTPYNLDSWMLFSGSPEGDLLFPLKKSAMGELHKAKTEEEALDNAKVLLQKYGVPSWIKF